METAAQKPTNGTSIELPSTNFGTQMGRDWTAQKIDQMINSADQNLQALGNVMFQNQAILEKYVVTVDKELRQIVIIKLPNFR